MEMSRRISINIVW